MHKVWKVEKLEYNTNYVGWEYIVTYKGESYEEALDAFITASYDSPKARMEFCL